MTQRERESLAASQPDADPHSMLFGDDGFSADSASDGSDKLTRADRRRIEHATRRRRSRRGLWFVLLTVLIVGAVAAVLIPKVVAYFDVPDYSGNGTASVAIVIPSGASAKDIGTILHDKDVVKSVEAFTDAADDNSASQSIQAGTYRLRLRMSANSALAALLDPSSVVAEGNIVVPEGTTTIGVAQRLVKVYGQASAAAITKALASPEALSVPSSYAVNGKFPSSAEGFIYPATYAYDPGVSPTEALTAMVVRFVQQDRNTGFAADAKSVGLTPYKALIVASIAQSEAKFSADMPKVARTILNRLKANMPLQFDSTSSYECKLAGTPADKCIYDTVAGPYNTYTNKGLPPTPIDNPGAEAMAGAVAPDKGAWLYFVNIDAAGHLGFFTNDKDFEKARLKCAKNNWGCA